MKLDKLTKPELLDLAAKKKIAGRSKMDKKMLIKALEKFYSPEVTNKKAPTSEMSSSTNIKEQKAAEKPIKIPRPIYNIPEFYDQDMLSLLPIDPSKEYVYWEISKHTYMRAKSDLKLPETKLLLKVFYEAPHAPIEVASIAIERIGNWYFNIHAPALSIWAEIGVIDSNGKFHSILKSKLTKMPDDKVSSVIDEETWLTIGKDIEKIYKLSGLGLKDLNSSEIIHKELINQVTQKVISSGNFLDKGTR